AARTTAEATRAQAQAAAEPAQRQAGLASFREIRDEMKAKIEKQNQRIDQLAACPRLLLDRRPAHPPHARRRHHPRPARHP
ncbi:hypothetical protein ABZ383_22030, partial [Streptomyces sp. NPDC005900]